MAAQLPGAAHDTELTSAFRPLFSAARPGTAIARPRKPAGRPAAAGVETRVVLGIGVVVAGAALAQPVPSSAAAPAANTRTRSRLITSSHHRRCFMSMTGAGNRQSPYAVDAPRAHLLHLSAARATCHPARTRSAGPPWCTPSSKAAQITHLRAVP